MTYPAYVKRYSDVGDVEDGSRYCIGFRTKNRDSAILEAPVVPCLTTSCDFRGVFQALCHTCQSRVEFTPKTASVVTQCFRELDIPSWDVILDIHFLFLRTESSPAETK